MINKKNPPFNIVLIAPEIPQNTGTIGRIAVETGCRLHLIKPLGFSLDDKYLKRAGLDYWPKLSPSIYQDWEDFLEKNINANLWFFSTHGKKSYYDVAFKTGDYLIFGKESAGLPKEFYQRYQERLCLIPMPGDFKRSINLACSVAAGLYEALRQTREIWDNN